MFETIGRHWARYTMITEQGSEGKFLASDRSRFEFLFCFGLTTSAWADSVISPGLRFLIYTVEILIASSLESDCEVK